MLWRWREHHLDALLEAIRLSFPQLRQWMPWALEMPTVEAERDFLRREEEDFLSGSSDGLRCVRERQWRACGSLRAFPSRGGARR